MSPAYQPIDWDNIHGLESYVGLKDCWRECDSYCCKTNHPDFSFRFIQSDRVQLPMSPSEYRFLRDRDKLQDTDRGSITTHSIEFSPEKKATVYMMRCTLGGRCRYPEFRPLICKVYPYFPVPRPEGGIEKLALGSVFDVARSLKDEVKGCPVLARDLPEIREKALARFAILFEHPHLIFYFRIGQTLMDIMKETLLKEHPEIIELPVSEFFRQWEVLYMTKQLFAPDKVAARFAQEYEAVRDIWGDFDTD